jgi:capsular exopolysaccharide synthesis family protein
VANYLAGERNLDALMQTYAPLPNLKIMTSGPVPPSPAELLSSEEMRRLIDEASARFAHVIIDSPPAVSFTDAAILSTMVDGVVLVVHGGHSSRAIVRRAKKLLQDVGAHIIGVVLNNVKLDAHDYQYYANYYAAYYDEEEDERDLPEGAAERGAH